MARFNLEQAARVVRELAQLDGPEYEALVARLELHEDEVAEWEKAAEALAIPFDEFLGVHPQDLHFLEREVWDLQNTPLAKRPLLLHYHPLVIYRFQVLKQADVVLALFLQGELFTAEQKRADFEYYDPITTGDSTLSAVVQAIMAAEVGYSDLARRYFINALFVDLADRHRNTSDGVHVASAGGVWSALVYGFGGFRDYGGRFSFDPRLPADWSALSFRLTIEGTRVRVTVRQDEIEFAVEDGTKVDVEVRGTAVQVTAETPVTVPLPDQGPRLAGDPQPVSGRHRADGSVIGAIVPGT
jgi:alpha,alpha-trehalose phosphorylase